MNVWHLSAKKRVARLWRNGGGITRDVAIFPDESSDDDFLWRASIATISNDGPFSTWRGVDRTLVVLGGQLALTIEGGGKTQLDENTSTVAFAGEEQVTAEPLGGPCLVLNLMARRDRTRVRLTRGSAACLITAGRTLLLATHPTTIRLSGLQFHLAETDVLMIGPSRALEVRTDRSVIIIELSQTVIA